MAGLKDFQRATVHHVMDRFFGADPTRRFLVADETVYLPNSASVLVGSHFGWQLQS